MIKNLKYALSSILLCLTSLSLVAQNVGTKADREALFDYIIEKTKIREAWSPPKEANLNFNPLADMISLKDEVVNAETDAKLYYALQKLSAARKDRHLRIRTVPGGLTLPNVAEGEALVRFTVDFSDPDKPFLFVADLARNGSEYTKGIHIGDQLLSINGEDVKIYLDRVKQYTRHSTEENFLKRAAEDLNEKGDHLPTSFFKEQLSLSLQSKKGKTYAVDLPYLDEVEWQYGVFFRDYPGYEEVTTFSYESFKLYRPKDSQNKTLLLWWYGFRRDLPEASDALVAWADANGALNHDLIIDAVDSRGGSQGAYALARLTSKPFKTTGGNLKLSDITYEFIANYTSRYVERKAQMDHDTRETEDDGSYAVEWLNGPVLKGLAAGQEYSNNTPFKCAHLPYYSDWIMQPAEKHFTGRMVVFFGPRGGSHLTQFAAMINDNDLGYTMGMQDGGYSNTWEWTEVLKFPGTDKPVVSFMWDIGHTIRPNGQIAEGNPSQVDEFIPVTRDNYLSYKQTLLAKAIRHLQQTPKEEEITRN